MIGRPQAFSVAGFVLAAFVSMTPLRGLPAASPPGAEDSCLVCHGDRELASAAGASVFVDPGAFSGSVRGRAGIGCVGCHADLAKVEDFPHAPKLRSVSCARCHGDAAGTSLAGVHGLASPRLVAKPVLCRDCHGYHDILPSTDERSVMSVSRRPASCAKCHPGAGANFARGRVHEKLAPGRASPAGVVRTLYTILIGAMTVFFVAYVSADFWRSRRER
jgi:Cytochrome c3